MSDERKKGGLRVKFAWFALALSVFLVGWFMAAGLGARFGLWGWQFGLGVMTFQWGPILIGVTGVVAVLSLILGIIRAPRVQPVILSLFALVIFVPFAGMVKNTADSAEILPPIHDVQTDWSDPIQYSDAIMSERAKTEGGVNPVSDNPIIAEYANGRWPGMGGRPVAEVQNESYKGLNTYIENVPTDVMFAAALQTLANLNIEIVTNDEESLVIEGTFTSRWYGFKDDIAVRIRPKGEGSEMDVRSTSRVGLSDLGANAKRVDGILEGVRLRLGKAPDPKVNLE